MIYLLEFNLQVRQKLKVLIFLGSLLLQSHLFALKINPNDCFENTEVYFEQSDLKVELKNEKRWCYDREIKLNLRLSKPLANNLKIKPWMVMPRDHQHGSRPPILALGKDLNSIEVSKLFFIEMPGDWYLLLELNRANSTVQKCLKVSLERCP